MNKFTRFLIEHAYRWDGKLTPSGILRMPPPPHAREVFSPASLAARRGVELLVRLKAALPPPMRGWGGVNYDLPLSRQSILTSPDIPAVRRIGEVFKQVLLSSLLISLLLSVRLTAPIFAQTPTPLPEPAGCLRPPDDYTQIQIGENTINARTLAMLQQAQRLYGGPIELTRAAITQGSYITGNPLSFGTHDSGGAVDISVRNYPIDYSIRYDDIPLLITALRTAGFAAWYRDEDDDMSPHIHSIALGDEELSRAAQLQITGRYGYLRGFDGLPQLDGVPQLDDSGELILCDWMRDLGYQDLREHTLVQNPPYNLAIGMKVYTNTVGGEELNLRTDPSLNSAILTTLPTETLVSLLDGPQLADGLRWWRVKTPDKIEGWLVEAADGGLTLVP